MSFKAANTWFIDYGADGYSTAYPPPASRWELAYTGYGDVTNVPAPADYDGDGFTDLSVKDSNGVWWIDWSSNGFGSWDESHSGYGNASATPVPGDYDGDGRADLAIKDTTGFWGVDYASDGYNGWNYEPSLVYGWTYGDANSIPVPADYDGDGKTDIAIKNNTTGTYSIDYASDGPGRLIRFGRTQWNVSVSGYGTATPIPADYNNDGKADIAEKDSSGTWMIDLAPTFGAWDQPFYTGYGPTSIGVPGDYDHDGLLDLSAVDPTTGDWYVDFANNGFGHWDPWPATGQTALHNGTRQLTDTSRPTIVSTKVYDQHNLATTTLLVGERYTVDVVLQPGTASNNAVCTSLGLVDGAPCSLGALGGTCSGGACVEVAEVERNPTLVVSPSLAPHDGSSFLAIKTWSCDDANHPSFGRCGNTPNCTSGTCLPHRRFAIECSQPGTYWLGYEVRNGAAWRGTGSYPGNPDYGTKIVCTASYTGLYGHVTERLASTATTSSGQPAFYTNGTAIQSAQIKILETGATTTSDVTGFWRLNVTGGPYTVQITASSHSDTIATSVNVPASGFELDTPMEEAFTPLRNAGATYTTYIDYSRNRLIVHVLALGSTTDAALRLQQAAITSMDPCGALTGPQPNAVACTDSSSPSHGSPTCPGFRRLSDEAATAGTLAVMNGVWWDYCTGNSLGYMYNGSQMPAFPFCNGGTPRPPDTSTMNCSGASTFLGDPGQVPLIASNTQTMLLASGQSHQQFSIVQSDQNYLETTAGTSWTRTSPTSAIWDPDHNGVSDPSYALQIGNPPLVWGNTVYAYGDFHGTTPNGDYDYVFPRTAVGVKTGPLGSTLFLVVTDAEGIQGGHGATANQLARFFHDVLQATSAFTLDSGNSTMMFLQGTKQATPRRVNVLTGEDVSVQSVPGLEYLDEKNAYFGAVANYLKIVSAPLMSQ